MEIASEHNHEHYETIQYAFVDESGNTDLPAPLRDSDFYVICSLLLPAHMLDQAREGADALVRLHAGSGELKSNKIKSNSRRRRRILEDIGKLDIPVYCLVVDKLQVWRDSGLQWKTSFYKFLHRMCYNRIRGSYTGIDVTADQFGNSDFMESFRPYISQRASLFDKFRFQMSNTVPLLQIADVVAGSVRRVWLQEDPIELLTALGYPSVPIEEWPPLASTATAHPPADTDECDQIILRTAVRLARECVEQHIDEGSDAERL